MILELDYLYCIFYHILRWKFSVTITFSWRLIQFKGCGAYQFKTLFWGKVFNQLGEGSFIFQKLIIFGIF